MTKEAEETEARKWLAKHAHDPEVAGASLPQDHHRSETGETAEWEQSGYLTAGDNFLGGVTSGTRSSESHRGLLSYSHLPVELTEELKLFGQGGRTREELDTRVRLERAMRKLRGDQQALLRMRYFEAMTLEEMGAELGRAKQSVAEKVGTAEQDLYVAIAETWNLPYDEADELLGVRPEGRPGRDRDGERKAALRSFLAEKGDPDA